MWSVTPTKEIRRFYGPECSGRRPHTVLEAMAIAGYAIGASQGYIYVRAEYPIAVERLRTAIAQAREEGMLGENIFNKGFSFDIELRLGSGAFVCGEETALLASVEGKRGMPRPRPPFPAVKGLLGCPTIINNVETLANIPPIILKGVEWFTSIGTERSKGTKVLPWPGKSTTPAWWRCQWALLYGRSSMISAVVCPEGKPLKPRRLADRQADVFLCNTWIFPLTMTLWLRLGP